MDSGDDDATPGRFVNFHSFLAHLMNSSMWLATTEDALRTMRRAFEESHEKESTEIQDAWVMGTAQWILWTGQSLIKLHLDPIGRFRHKGTPIQNIDVIITTKPISLDMWHTWMNEFRKAAESDEFGEECREVAKRAANLMEVLEKSMLK